MLKPGDRAVAGRYAQALFDAGQKSRVTEALRLELDRLVDLLGREPALSAALAHPRVPSAVKAELVGLALGKPSAVMARFVGLLFEKKRLDALHEIARRFAELADQAQGVKAVQVRTAAPLSKVQEAALGRALDKMFGKTRLSATVDPSLLGGMVVQSGDRVWDQSLRGGLARLSEELLATSKN